MGGEADAATTPSREPAAAPQETGAEAEAAEAAAKQAAAEQQAREQAARAAEEKAKAAAAEAAAKQAAEQQAREQAARAAEEKAKAAAAEAAAKQAAAQKKAAEVVSMCCARLACMARARMPRAQTPWGEAAARAHPSADAVEAAGCQEEEGDRRGRRPVTCACERLRPPQCPCVFFPRPGPRRHFRSGEPAPD